MNKHMSADMAKKTAILYVENNMGEFGLDIILEDIKTAAHNGKLEHTFKISEVFPRMAQVYLESLGYKIRYPYDSYAHTVTMAIVSWE
jgi:hypothetical protein